jgi:hypothetical protein
MDFLLNLFVQVLTPNKVELTPAPTTHLVAPPTPLATPTAPTDAPAASPTPPALLASEPLPASPAGLVFKNVFQPEAGALNAGSVMQQRITLEQTVRENGVEYVDSCPSGERAEGYAHVSDFGTTLESSRSVTPYMTGRAEARSWFISSKTPPAEGLRVVVRNAATTQSIAQMPYTDREYDKGLRSESFIVGLADGHSSKFLAVKSGENQFVYQIKRGDQIVESGEFTANIGIDFQDVAKTTIIPRPKERLHCKRKDQDGHHGHDKHDRY